MSKKTFHERRAEIAEGYLERIGRADNMVQVRVLYSQWQSESYHWHPMVVAGRVTQRLAKVLGRQTVR